MNCLGVSIFINRNHTLTCSADTPDERSRLSGLIWESSVSSEAR